MKTAAIKSPEISSPEVSLKANASAKSANPGAWIGLALFALIINLPFINQAFHMDDGTYLLRARNVDHSLLFPENAPAYFEGFYAQDVASTEHLWPLTEYVLALSAHLAKGYSEVPLHIGFLVFPMILACSMYFLGRRFTAHPVLTSLILLTVPVVSVMAHTLMTDLPLLAFWVASVALFCRGVDLRKKSLVCLGGIAVTIASFISYAGICLIPLLGLYAILRKDRPALFSILVLPSILFACRLGLDYFHYHRFTPGMLFGYYFTFKQVLSPTFLAKKFAYIMLVLGAVSLIPSIALSFLRRKLSIIVLLSAVLAGVLSATNAGYGPLQVVTLVALLWAGLVLSALVAQLSWKTILGSSDGNPRFKDDLFLCVWFMGMVAFCGAAYMTGSARYLLPVMPPMILILVRLMERELNEKRLRWVACGSVILGCSLGILLSIADYQFAGIYREFAGAFQQEYAKRTGRVWFSGEWGLRAYLERLGAQELGRNDPRPTPGDLLVVPSLATPYETLFGETLNLKSIILVAPSRLYFEVSKLPSESELIYTVGMPIHEKSDGMDYSVHFESGNVDHVLYRGHLVPDEAKRWKKQSVPLQEIAGENGSIVFSAEVGASGNADADWIALARAAIWDRATQAEAPLYDFGRQFDAANIESTPGVQYHTPENRPAFRMTVRLEQEPAMILRGRYDYRPTLPVRMLDAGVHAGFWCMSWGFLPFSLTSSDSPPLETIRVYEVIRRVDAYGESTPSWYQR